MAQKDNKTKHDWLGKMIHWELSNWLKFDHTTKWYKHKPESVLENETRKILGDSGVQVDHEVKMKESKKKKKKTKRNINK